MSKDELEASETLKTSWETVGHYRRARGQRVSIEKLKRVEVEGVLIDKLEPR